METPQEKREEIFQILHDLTGTCQDQYPYSDDYITTYRIEILAGKKDL